MSASNFIFAVYDSSTGAPLTGYAGSLSFSTYKDETGANLSQPAIVEVGGGLYKFAPAFVPNHAIGFILNTGGANPNYIFGHLRAEDFGVVAPSPAVIFFPIYDLTTGAPKAGVSPSFSTFDDDVGTPLTQPSITDIGGGLYKFTPAFSTPAAIAYVVATGGNLPPRHSGFIRPEDFQLTGFVCTGAVATPGTITLSFTSGYSLDNPGAAAAVAANWTVTGPSAVTVTVVTRVGNQVVLTVSGAFVAGTYTLTIPAGITASAGTIGLLGPPSIPFAGAAGDPVMVQAVDIDERVVDVYFAFAPDPVRALDATNYSITPSLNVVGVVKVSDTVYRLTTSAQAIGTTYTITWPLH